MVQVGEEDVRIGGRGDGHRGDHAAQAHCAQDGDDLPVSLRRPSWMRAPPRQRAKRRVIVVEMPLSSRKTTFSDRSRGCAGGTRRDGYGWLRCLVQRRGATFFQPQTKPDHHKCTSPNSSKRPCPNGYAPAARQSQVWLRLDQVEHVRLDRVVTLLRMPYRDCAIRAFCPVAACCRRSLRTYSQLTPKRLASTRQLPSPAHRLPISSPADVRIGSSILAIAVTSPEKYRITPRRAVGYIYLDAL